MRTYLDGFEGATMATTEKIRLEEENRELRRMLARFGVHSSQRRPGEKLQEENWRLQEDVRWYERLLRDSHWV